ncbi:hypothetical protein [Kitasatospora sp. NPDC097643]|uniref:hypothetical protein n=1 Tax=Kitasatospora sp. NPDC097643 TaxID=3157230 RepID=UPI00332C0251
MTVWVAWAVDVVCALVLAGVVVGAVAWAWLAEGMRGWAAQGRPAPVRRGPDRLKAAFVGGAALSAAATAGFWWAGLPVTAVTQGLLAVPLGVLAVDGLGYEARRALAVRCAVRRSARARARTDRSRADRADRGARH